MWIMCYGPYGEVALDRGMGYTSSLFVGTEIMSQGKIVLILLWLIFA